jgi:hypothetical protein
MSAEPGSSSEHALKALGRIAAQDADLDSAPQPSQPSQPSPELSSNAGHSPPVTL